MVCILEAMFSFVKLLSSVIHLKGLGHVTANNSVIPIIYIVADTWPLCSAQILVDGVNPQ